MLFFEKFCIHHICVFSFLETLKTFSIHFVCKTLSVFSRSLKFMQKLNLKCKNFSTYNKLLVHQLHPNSLVLHRKVCFFRYILERFLVRLLDNWICCRDKWLRCNFSHLFHRYNLYNHHSAIEQGCINDFHIEIDHYGMEENLKDKKLSR